MSSPAHSISSADEEAKEFAELKAKHEAELREAAERKARRDQERQERCEKKKREEREVREEITRRIQEVGKAVAEVAQGIAETEQEQEEREQEALRRMCTAERPTEAEEVPLAKPVEGSGGDKGSGQGASEVEGEEESDASKHVDDVQRSPQRRVVCSRQNTTEVVIVRPAAKGKGAEVSGPADEVSSVSISAKVTDRLTV